MRFIVFVILLTIGSINMIHASTPINESISFSDSIGSFPILPESYREAKFQEIQEAIEQRTLFFLKGRQHQLWQNNKSDEDIAKEFEQINDWRLHAWYTNPGAPTLVSRADFMIAQDLLEKGLFRHPNLIAFEYNRTDPSYNSSTIVLNGLRFLALEAPSLKNNRNFLTLLKNQAVYQLVRLTSAQESGKEKSYKYWEGNLKKDPKTGTLLFNIPQEANATPYPVLYYPTDAWKDHQGIEPKALLNLIQNVRKTYDPNRLLACHCSAGVGRTGTFLAGFILLTEIDTQIASGKAKKDLNVSIEKVVMQLSLQRTYMVASLKQYKTLYRMVDLYVASLKEPEKTLEKASAPNPT